jgi:serine/threonine-protein kinase
MAPTPDRWQKIEALYHAALERDPASRAAFLDGACGHDDELRREIESLLAADPTGQGLLDRPVSSLLAESATIEFEPGACVGAYQIEGVIGQGGMGKVYRARDTRLGRIVAIKTSSARFSDRFEREARAIAALNHPHICHLYHVGPDYLVMEYVEGTPLKGPLPMDAALKYAEQVCDALDAAHQKGIVHRDLKPANILLAKHGIKLLDFGLAQMEAGPDDPTMAQMTQAGAVIGTPAYMAPEQWEGKKADARSDIYSFGCVLYEMLTGKRAAGEREAVAPPLGDVLRTCLEKDPEDRWQSARELKHALHWAAQAGPGGARSAISPASHADGILTRSLGDRRSVAVIPFRFRTALAEDQFLSVALADAVANRLGSNGKLLVRPTSSVLRYAGTDTEWGKIAGELNVDLVVEGTIQKMGPKIRVLVQAHQASDSRTLHSSRHDGGAEDLFGLQDRIADSVSEVFVPRKDATVEPAIPPTANPMAYELYLRAVDRVFYLNKFDLGSAIEILIRVTDLDPNFADAWGLLAQAYSQMGQHLDPDPQWFERAEHAIARTLELDPVQCDALCARGTILWSPSRGFQTRPALRAMNAALKVNPNRFQARMFRAAIFFHIGFYEESGRDQQESLLANPGFAMAVMGQGNVALYRGDYDAANELFERVLAMEPALVLANIFAPLPALLLGRIGVAREKIDKARQMVPEEPQLTCLTGLIAAHEGDFKLAEQLADEVCTENKKSVTHTHHTWHYAAGVYAICGKPEKALQQLRRCAQMGLPNYLLFGSDPFLRTLRDHPDFTALMSDLRREHDRYREEFRLAGETPAAIDPERKFKTLL